MRPPTTSALVGLLCAGPTLIAAAPQHHVRSPAPSAGRLSDSWQRFSQAVVGTLWGSASESRDALESSTTEGLERTTGAAQTEKAALLDREDIVIRFTIKTAEEASALAEATETLFLDVWEFNADWADIRIAKHDLPSLLGLLPPSLQQAHVPLMQDLDLAQAIIDTYPTTSFSTQPENDPRRPSPRFKAQTTVKNPFFQNYQPMSVITPWMNLMASMFSTHVRRINIGMSYEGRDIPGLRVGVHPTNDEQEPSRRKTILITGGSHAREWISVSTVNYIAWRLIEQYGKDRFVTRMLEAFDFVFVPTLNPDGYVYSWETDRLWRKNRQPTSLRFCQGIDLDRSYSFKWDGDARSNPCSESYAGDGPFDAVEAQRFADWAKNETLNNNVEFLGLFDLHSYSQQILYPYSFTCDEEPPTIEDLEELGLGLAKAIRTGRKGHFYSVSSACEGNVAMSKSGRRIFPRIESTGGSALDWFYHELKVTYAYQIKLRDTGSYGFLLPKENIVPTGDEVLEAINYFGRFVLGQVGFAVREPEFQRPSENQKPPQGDEERGDDGDFMFELRRKR